MSQTGKSAEVYAALQDTGCPRLVVTDVDDSPLTGLAEAVVPLSLLPDSNVRTIGYTGTIQALGLLRDAVAGRDHTASADPTWEDAADGLEALLPAAEELAEGLLPRLRGVTAFDVVGSGVHAGTALQGALLLREVCKLPATGYETYQYLHGPVEAAAARPGRRGDRRGTRGEARRGLGGGRVDGDPRQGRHFGAGRPGDELRRPRDPGHVRGHRS